MKNKKNNKKNPKKKKYTTRKVFGSREELAQSLENLALLLEAGVGVQQALTSIQSEVKNKKLKKIYADMVAGIDNGESLSIAFEKSRLLPSHLLSLLKSGEESGRLTENLGVITRQQERDLSFRSKLKAAMFYPIVVIVLAFTVGFGLAWFVLPKLADAFSQLGSDLPATTRILINAGAFMKENATLVLLGFGSIATMGLSLTFFSGRFRQSFVQVFSKFPGISRLVKEIELARFGFIAGGMLESGIPIVETFRSLEESTTIRKFKTMYGMFAERLEQGESFKKIIETRKKSVILPGSIQQMILAGEQSGSLSKMLQTIGKRYEEKIDNTSKNLSSILEPILLIIVAVVVGFVAISIILPIYSLIGNLG